MVKVVGQELHKGAPYAPLLEKKSKSGGRNNNGRITTRHIGGGHKQHYRLVDFRRNKDGIQGVVERLEYDPNRSARIALLQYADGEKRYILWPHGLGPGAEVVAGLGAADAAVLHDDLGIDNGERNGHQQAQERLVRQEKLAVLRQLADEAVRLLSDRRGAQEIEAGIVIDCSGDGDLSDRLDQAVELPGGPRNVAPVSAPGQKTPKGDPPPARPARPGPGGG